MRSPSRNWGWTLIRCFFPSGSCCRRDGFFTSGWFASSFLHRDWFGDRKDLLRKNFWPSVGRYFTFVQYLHGSFWTIATSCSTGSWIQYACHICSSVGTVGRLFYWTHVHCDVWMRRSSQDIGSLGWSSYDYVILHVNRRPSGRWDKVWLKTRSAGLSSLD